MCINLSVPSLATPVSLGDFLFSAPSFSCGPLTRSDCVPTLQEAQYGCVRRQRNSLRSLPPGNLASIFGDSLQTQKTTEGWSKIASANCVTLTVEIMRWIGVF